ncbi:class I SAM-dependent methyltransferase [Nitriliruptor alkaliphilus]|uniref:class I SAM-dependent methyltransferase n=1 Tax=Nitriliruptor alkaliphilus TaxID=427918 RepID=UPI0006966798|nr:class I SAM-dependent methyltransferase [Nitriliruptor alkaliphilus]
MPSVEPDLTTDVARWLISDAGLDAITQADADLQAGRSELQVVTARRRDGLDAPQAAAAVGAAQARGRARARWPDADRLVFTRTGLEQASDPTVSAWRARRFEACAAVEDRAAGCGGDTLALAATSGHVTAVDLDEGRLVLLAHNAAVRELSVTTVVADALQRPAPSDGPVHVDPGRRAGGRRVRRLADHRPSVPALVDHLRDVAARAGLAIVLGPAVDPEDGDLPPGAELEFVQVGGQLVEAVAWTGALRDAASHRTATILPAPTATDSPAAADAPTPVTRSRGPRGPRLPVGPVGDLLVEVAPAAVRARLHDELGAEIGARRLSTRRALLTVDGDLATSPWWRARRVETVLPAGARAIRRWLRGADDRPVELVLHGVAVEPSAFLRELGRPRTGPGGRRIELVRGDEGAFAVITAPPGR